MRRVDQVLADMQVGDAISNHAFALQQKIHQLGWQGDIYAQHIDPRLLSRVRSIKEYKPQDTVIHHFAIGSDVNQLIKGCRGVRRVLIYHNITPAHFFAGYNLHSYTLCQDARKQLAQMKDSYELCLPVSEYNKQELEELGFSNVHVLPLLYRFDGIWLPKKEATERKTILFVGRIAPNKCQQDIIKAFYEYQKNCDASAQLLLVGSSTGMEKYERELRALVKSLGVKRVTFTGKISDEELAMCYRQADLLLSMSEHEGFCVPLLEAMRAGVPILAYASSAIPETLGGAGVLFYEKDYRLVAEMMHEILQNDVLRNGIIEKQYQRLEAFSPERISLSLEEWLQDE